MITVYSSNMHIMLLSFFFLVILKLLLDLCHAFPHIPRGCFGGILYDCLVPVKESWNIWVKPTCSKPHAQNTVKCKPCAWLSKCGAHGTSLAYPCTGKQAVTRNVVIKRWFSWTFGLPYNVSSPMLCFKASMLYHLRFLSMYRWKFREKAIECVTCGPFTKMDYL